MNPARQALLRLLRKAEKARAKGAEEAIELAMTPARCPEYCGLRTLGQYEQFEAEIALAVREGAIDAERERFRGQDARLRRLRLVSLERLGAYLGTPLRSERVDSAAIALAAALADHPVLDTVLDLWRHGRQVRGHGPEAATDLADAAKVIAARGEDERQERLLRRESVRLFGDSKRLETLTPWLDLLLTSEVSASGLEHTQVWSALGLRREPQPVLVAGHGTALLQDHRVALCRPYLGLPVDAVRTIEAEARYVLTVENLTSFHDAARALQDRDALLIYTGGMPSPAWRAFFVRLLGSLPMACKLYHWGDIDEGGFRIAAHLATAAKASGRCLHPWLMSPREVETPAMESEAPSAACVNKMTYWAEKAGWPQIASELRQKPIRIEQEAIDPRFP